MVSADGGKSWGEAALQGPVHPQAFTRFGMPWRWDGQPAVLQSRAWDEAGNAQPLREEFVAARGETKKPVTNPRGIPQPALQQPHQLGHRQQRGDQACLRVRRSLAARSLLTLRRGRGRRRDAQARQADHRSRHRRLGHRRHAGRHRLAARQRHARRKARSSMRRSASPATAKAARAASRPALARSPAARRSTAASTRRRPSATSMATRPRCSTSPAARCRSTCRCR